MKRLESTVRIFLIALFAPALFAPFAADAHTPGALDPYGCHADRRKGGYHCHRGKFNGLSFSSKGQMLKERKDGTIHERAAEQAKKKKDQWWNPFAKRSDDAGDDAAHEETSSAASSSTGSETGAASVPVSPSPSVVESAPVAPAIVPPPSGTSEIERRLAELKSLYDRGLIDEADYTAKKREILSDL